MNKNFNRRCVFIIIVVIIFSYSFIGSKGEVVENNNIPIGIGYQLEENGDYGVLVSMNEFTSSSEIVNKIIKAESSSLGNTRDDHQRKANKKYILGFERLYVISDKYAQNGIRNIIDILLDNPQVSDRSPAIVFNGKAEDLLKYKIKGFVNSAEYVGDMIKNSIYYNFFSQQFSMLDLIVRIDAEGRNAILPYVELKEEGPEIVGLAIFKEDKMIGKTNMQEARIINLLKFNGGKGILTIQKDRKHYINFYAQNKRKVKCYKTDGRYKFVIDINLKGSIASNELYDNLNKDPKVLKEFAEDMQDSVKRMCTEYINKANHEYKVDILDLGRVAAAKYGRQTGVDWDKVVSESSIEVNVKVTVNDEGRGQY